MISLRQLRHLMLSSCQVRAQTVPLWARVTGLGSPIHRCGDIERVVVVEATTATFTVTDDRLAMVALVVVTVQADLRPEEIPINYLISSNVKYWPRLDLRSSANTPPPPSRSTPPLAFPLSLTFSLASLLSHSPLPPPPASPLSPILPPSLSPPLSLCQITLNA